LLRKLETFGGEQSELSLYRESLESFLKDQEVAAELFRSIEDPNDETAPSPDVLENRWKAIGGRELPDTQLWPETVTAFRREGLQQAFLSETLREILSARNIDRLLKEVRRQGGVSIQVSREKYFQRMKTKYSPVDLANLMPASVEDPGRMIIRDVFVPQIVRENPPSAEIPKDLAERYLFDSDDTAVSDSDQDFHEQDFSSLRKSYLDQAPTPALDIVTAQSNRLLVLTGDPGSGKSTLLRYLLTGIIEPPHDQQTGSPLQWTKAFQDFFPLLIELRDFHALRQRKNCETFLEYVSFMGKTQQWFLDDHALDDHLDKGSSLVMFDGVDEIFDPADRNRILDEIAGFSQRYSRARIIATSRPIGYKHHVLRSAGFSHFGIQDLDEDSIEAFVKGWFALTFPQNPQEVDQRVHRVLDSVRRSKSIRLLAGNPMLLTIMVLLGREQEMPRERVKFYEKAVEVLCHHWDANRNLSLPDDRYLNADDKKSLLRRIAMRMQVCEGGLKGNFIHNEDLEQEIKSYLIDEELQPDKVEAKKAARRMINQLHERNYILCLRAPDLFGFVHRTFLEYLMATEYVRRFDKQPQRMTIEDLICLFKQHCRDDDWREVLRLICGQIDETIVGKILDSLITKIKGNSPPELPLSILCLNEVRNQSKLREVGSKLLTQVARVSVETKNKEYLSQELLPACKEIGERWPGKESLRKRIVSQLQRFRENEWGQEFWPRFVAYLLSDRDSIAELALTEEGPAGGSHVRAAALDVMAEKWPDEETRSLLEERAVQDADGHACGTALKTLAEVWPDDRTREILIDRAVAEKNEWVRVSAVWALRKWRTEESVHEFLKGRITNDSSGIVRGVALHTIARNWPDRYSRDLAENLLINDPSDHVRNTAFSALAEIWKDDDTRKKLHESASSDSDVGVRQNAIWKLVRTWPDDVTKEFLIHRSSQDKHELIRSTALRELGEKWGESGPRELFETHAVNDEHKNPRVAAVDWLARIWPDDSARVLLNRCITDVDMIGPKENRFEMMISWRGTALGALVSNWHDEEIRMLLEDLCVHDRESNVRSTAIEGLANNWPTENTHRLLEGRARKDTDAAVRNAALRGLVENWPEESFRSLLEERAQQDSHEHVRNHAIRAIAEKWPDGEARELLERLAVTDNHESVRAAALEAIAMNWPDDNTRKLLKNRAEKDDHENVRMRALRALREKLPEEDKL
jgi:energy-coupling factor transporter ATP-binding protein EcfA2